MRDHKAILEDGTVGDLPDKVARFYMIKYEVESVLDLIGKRIVVIVDGEIRDVPVHGVAADILEACDQ